MSKLWGIWSKTNKGWVYDDNGDCTYRLKREAFADIRKCFVHPEDYEVREYAKASPSSEAG